MQTRVRLDPALLVVAIAGVSFSGPLIAATAAPALAIAFWRNALGGSVTSGWALLRSRAELRTAGRRLWGRSTLAGVFLAVHFGTWIPSLTMTTVASSTALVSLQSVFTALVAARQGQPLPRPAWAGMVCAVIGAALITGADVEVGGRALLGDVLALVGGLAAALYVTVGASVRTSLGTAAYTAICYVTCALALLVVCLIGGTRLAGYPSGAWLRIIAVTVVAQLLGHTVFNVVLRSLGATTVSLAVLFEVPGAALIAYLWLHQRPPWTAVPGVLLLLAGVAVVTVVRRSRTPADVV